LLYLLQNKIAWSLNQSTPESRGIILMQYPRAAIDKLFLLRYGLTYNYESKKLETLPNVYTLPPPPTTTTQKSNQNDNDNDDD
jgi:hypothetical protein